MDFWWPNLETRQWKMTTLLTACFSSSFTHREFIGSPKKMARFTYYISLKFCVMPIRPMHLWLSGPAAGFASTYHEIRLWMPVAREESYCFRNRGEIWTGSEGWNLKEKRRMKEKWDDEDKTTFKKWRQLERRAWCQKIQIEWENELKYLQHTDQPIIT